MTPFKAPIDDILFSLHSVASASALPTWDSELCAEIVQHFTNFAENEIAPLDEPGDLQGCVLTNGQVHMPDGFRDAFAKLSDAGWQGLTAPEAYGGMGQNSLVAAAVSEVFSGANHSLQMVCNLVPGAMTTLRRYGTVAQQAKWLRQLATGKALSTMCLTEPGAGSDLSRIRSRASIKDGAWRITGEKIFISGGDQDLSDDILHIVLARTGESDAGVKGLSLFLCSKLDAGASIRITRIENKLGLHASPTCHMVFDNASAELIGEEGFGLKAMFTLMNHARVDVALQGVAHAARAYALAAAYAEERPQGRKADGTNAVLSDHADVRRMLDEQRCLVLGARSMAHITLFQLETGKQQSLVDFLTPVVKVFGSDAGIRAADLGIQILGGYGYLSEYRISQTWRDARITSLYEGANGIHALSTATRGLRVDDGAGADAFVLLVSGLSTHTDVQKTLDVWKRARHWIATADNPTELAHEFMQLTCELFYRAVWSRIAEASVDAELDRLRDIVLARPIPVSLARFGIV